MSLTYFAYGSNMASRRLLQRLPKAKLVGVATLAGHRLSFRKSDCGISGKCDIELTGNEQDRVLGVIYQISPEDKPILDRIEGLGVGYDQKTVELTNSNRETLQAFTYFALQIDADLTPYHWYKEHVLRGAIEHQLDDDYIAVIRDTPSRVDEDAARSERELAIYL